MNINKFDVAIIFAMSICVILLTLTAGNFGLTDRPEANQSDFPEYNASAGSFDIAGDFPDSPGTPSSGTAVYRENGLKGDGINQIWLEGEDTSSGTTLVLSNGGTSADPEAQITVTEWNNDAVQAQETFTLQNEGDQARYSNNSWNIVLENERMETGTDDGTVIEASFGVRASPDDSGLLGGIPIIGDIADGLASLVGYIGAVIFWIGATIIEVTVTLILQVVNLVTWFFGTIYWLSSTYVGIIESAPGFASAIVIVPGLLLFFEFAKITAVIVSLLPTT